MRVNKLKCQRRSASACIRFLKYKEPNPCHHIRYDKYIAAMQFLARSPFNNFSGTALGAWPFSSTGDRLA